MLDFSHIPKPFAGAADRQVFIGNMNAAVNLSQQWVKPRGVTMVHILCIGQGGNGANATAGATSAGGAGGGSGAQSSLLIPAVFLPDVCYVGAGSGGAGTAVNTYFAAKPNGATAASVPLAPDMFLMAGGAIGNAVTAGSTGALPASSILSGHGVATFLAGVAGGAAGAATGAVGATVAANTTGLFVSGGGGGAGMSAAAAFAGGPSTSSFPSYLPTSLGGAAGTSGVAGGAGQAGVNLLDGRYLFGGGGGGGTGFPVATASAGGNGGAGGYGCGGGGGGGSVTGQVAGLGGAGGAGCVIVHAW